MSRTTRQAAAMLGIGILIVTACRAMGADWSQWRGPDRNGISKETGLLKQWPPDGPKLLWQQKDIGPGFSTPALVGDRLYLLANRGLADEFVEALRASDGGQVWAIRIGKVGNPGQQPNYPAARSTPTVDGDLLYALGSDGDLVCLDTVTGNLRWKKNLRSDFGGQPGTWAYAESPLIDGDLLVCTPGGAQATLIALNKKTGEVIWKSQVPGGDQAAYSSAIIDRVGGVKQYVQFLQNGLVGIDARTGKFLWRYNETAKGSPANIPTPTADNDLIYSGASLSGGGLVKLTTNGDAVTAIPVYFSKKLPTAIGGTVLIDKNLYGTTSQVLQCVDFPTGKVRWSNRSIGPASVLWADGLLFLHGENGDVALVQATPAGYRERGRFTPPDPPDRGSAKAWPYPVLANGRLYIRDGSCLWCYDVRGR